VPPLAQALITVAYNKDAWTAAHFAGQSGARQVICPVTYRNASETDAVAFTTTVEMRLAKGKATLRGADWLLFPGQMRNDCFPATAGTRIASLTVTTTNAVRVPSATPASNMRAFAFEGISLVRGIDDCRIKQKQRLMGCWWRNLMTYPVAVRPGLGLGVSDKGKDVDVLWIAPDASAPVTIVPAGATTFVPMTPRQQKTSFDFNSFAHGFEVTGRFRPADGIGFVPNGRNHYWYAFLTYPRDQQPAFPRP